MTGGLACPDRADHEQAQGERLARQLSHGFAEHRANATIIAVLGEGSCPACANVGLDREPVTLYSRTRSALRCSCCKSLWILESDADQAEWTLLDRGRLIETP